MQTTTPPLLEIKPSPLDSHRFGVQIGRAALYAPEHVGQALAYCRENALQMLIVRCGVEHLPTVQALEAAGGRLMDTIVTYAIKLKDNTPPPDDPADPLRVRLGRPEDAPIMAEITGEAFRGFYGHYHADPRLDPRKADAGYEEWGGRCFSVPGVSDVNYVAEYAGEPVGYYALRRVDQEVSEGVISAVRPDMQGKGIFRRLMQHAMAWGWSIGTTRMLMATLINNLATQKAVVRLGFEPAFAHYTFHWWLD
jgi:GNAT superfamily N-acetyltransferase